MLKGAAGIQQINTVYWYNILEHFCLDSGLVEVEIFTKEDISFIQLNKISHVVYQISYLVYQISILIY